MTTPTLAPESISESGTDVDRRREIVDLVRRLADLLPIHGPISAFVFLNMLQGLEDRPFHDALKEGMRIFGSEPYLSEDEYRNRLASGRISRDDLADVLRYDLAESADEVVAGLATRFEIRMAMLEFPIRTGPPEELQWFVAETDALQRTRAEASPAARERIIDETRKWFMRALSLQSEESALTNQVEHDLVEDLLARFGGTAVDRWPSETWEAVALQSLWRTCYNGVLDVPSESTRQPGDSLRMRDCLYGATAVDTDQLVNELLIPFATAFVDQGAAAWKLPGRELGFWKCFSALFRETSGNPLLWIDPLEAELRRIEQDQLTPTDVIIESLQAFGITKEQTAEFLTRTLVALKGLGGMLWQLEVRADRVPYPVPEGNLVEFLAVRLLLDRLAVAHVARSALGYRGSLAELREFIAKTVPRPVENNVVQRTFPLFQVAQVLGWSAPALRNMNAEEWIRLVREIESFCQLERRRNFQIGFERRFRVRVLDAIAAHRRHPVRRVPNPKFQAAFCIDSREESFRRYIEEVEPHAETFAAAGFYNIPIYYKGVADAHFSTLCPIVVRPRHWVTEEVVYSLEEENRRRARTRQFLGQATRTVHVGSRRVAGGALLTAAFGYLATVPLVARVLAPRLTARIRRHAARFVDPPPVTRLRLERRTADPGPSEDAIGFTIDEMANFGERVLRDIGLTTSFSRLVFFFGHGSFCLNNPHKSAYDCGACCGAGGPNARALAAFLNDPRVRTILVGRGLAIPAETYFIGGSHNTGTDSITYYDIDSLPATHIRDFEQARETLVEACRRNAHERCRRFHSAAVSLTPEEAKKHVEERCEDLAQVRPEYGNASNAACIVGRRGRTRGLYLDRRCFMQSYEPSEDDEEATILGRILGAVVPVCEGINLQYYFSRVDSTGWACGTKLPHNVVSLLGVMDGAASDLRPGLPWQGVEIHEPIRLLFVIETTPEKIRKIMARDPTVRKIIEGRWVHLSLIDPDTSEILVYRRGEFIPYVAESATLPQVRNSIDWYRGLRDHLGFAEVTAGLTPES